jgi:SAM-dependent methyltransferase/uncharacterized protein YbaR (Trm112 family)
VITSELQELLVCPLCRGPLALCEEPPALSCSACGVEYPVRSGIPILRPSGLQVGPAADTGGSTHKDQQVAYFDQDPDDDFGIVRPRGAPKLYSWLLKDKFRRSIVGLEELVPRSRALVVCGGSGLDAEFLVRAGAKVILSDISLGVVLQARERSRRFGLGFELIVADTEALPFRDAAVDLVYVHDGLHHLEQPAHGLVEMARVARHAVSVSEPAQSVATSAAARLGWAEDTEDAGNRVMRLKLDEITRGLRASGFRPIQPHRYAMFYRHWPGRAMRALSWPPVFPLAVGGMALANRLVGRYGNKLVVQALRSGE